MKKQEPMLRPKRSSSSSTLAGRRRTAFVEGWMVLRLRGGIRPRTGVAAMSWRLVENPALSSESFLREALRTSQYRIGLLFSGWGCNIQVP
jgi:hypothetical protein